MGERTRFVGVDAHAKTLAVAIAEEAGQPESYGQIANDPTAVRKLVSRLGGGGVRLVVAPYRVHGATRGLIQSAVPGRRQRPPSYRRRRRHTTGSRRQYRAP